MSGEPRPGTGSGHLRFTLADRVQHGVMLVSFVLLALTGLPQRYVYLNSRRVDGLIDLMGGLETVRVAHRVAAVALMLVTIWHLLSLAERVWVRRDALSMLPRLSDLRDAWQSVRYNLGRAAARPRMGRFTWEEKLEYWSLVWGTLVMIATGFMLWNPIATARFVPGEFIPAAQVVHSGEALLAVLAVLVWHFYAVHVRSFNRSMFTGRLSEAEMEHEHPLELAERRAPRHQPDAAALRKRRRVFTPAAAAVTVLLLLGLYWFVSFEQTAITTRPPGASRAPSGPAPRS